MRANGNEKAYGGHQYRLKKSYEYESIERLRVSKKAYQAYRHKPYANDFRRNPDEEE